MIHCLSFGCPLRDEEPHCPDDLAVKRTFVFLRVRSERFDDVCREAYVNIDGGLFACHVTIIASK
jgi:hypothetical protein